MVLVYATPSDLDGWLTSDGVPENAQRLIRSASLLVADATRAARYDVDTTTGLPYALTYVEALRDATCAQVAAWDALGIDPAKGAAGVPAVEASKSIGGASISYAVGAQVEAAATSATALCEEALRILAGAGLLSSRVAVW